MHIKRLLLLLLLLAIYQLSNTSGLRVIDPTTWTNQAEYQQHVPKNFLLDVQGEFYSPYDHMTDINFIMHKLAHIIFYALLAYLLLINLKRQVGWAVFFLFLAALGDEIHQFYIVGRSGRALDVLVDVAAGTVAIIVIQWITKRKIN